MRRVVPRIVDRRSYGGADARIQRLGLAPLWTELEKILTSFQLVVLERQEIIAGTIDVGVLVTPSDKLAVFLTDRAAYFSAATQAVERARAHDLPILVIALEHDGAGAALAKQPKAASGTGKGKRKRPQL
jgi:hypothetical protein